MLHCHLMYDHGCNVYTQTSHTDLSTDLSWDRQSLILWQQWRREGVGRGRLEGREDSHEMLHGSTHIHTYPNYTNPHTNANRDKHTHIHTHMYTHTQ